MTMPARYALRYETANGTLEDPWHHMPRMADALKAARRASKECACQDVVRVWVDDTRTGLGVQSFEVTR